MVSEVASAESKADEIGRLQREIAERQSRLNYLVLGDIRQSTSVGMAPKFKGWKPFTPEETKIANRIGSPNQIRK